MMTAVLAESEGYEAEMLAGGKDKDILLTRRGDIQPSVVVCCSPVHRHTPQPANGSRIKHASLPAFGRARMLSDRPHRTGVDIRGLRAAQVVEGGERVRPDHVEELVDRDRFVGRAHARR